MTLELEGPVGVVVLEGTGTLELEGTAGPVELEGVAGPELEGPAELVELEGTAMLELDGLVGTLELEGPSGLVVLEGTTTLELEGAAEPVELELKFKLVSVLVPIVDSEETLVTLPVELESTAVAVELVLVRVEALIKDGELVEGRRMQILGVVVSAVLVSEVEAMTTATRSTKLAPSTPAFTIVAFEILSRLLCNALIFRSRRLHIAQTCMRCNAMHSDL